MSAKSKWGEQFLDDLSNPRFRHSYMADQVRTGIAYQIKAMRDQTARRWTQGQLGDRIGKPQSVIARLENPDYGRVTLTTLLEVAQALDVALLVQFAEWPEFFERMADVSPAALAKNSFDLASFVAVEGEIATQPAAESEAAQMETDATPIVSAARSAKDSPLSRLKMTFPAGIKRLVPQPTFSG